MTSETASIGAEWKRTGPDLAPALVEGTAGVPVPAGAGWFKRAAAFAGPGYMISVGYMDPGNWATDLAGGAAFGYKLLFVILVSNLMAVLLQALSVRLGVVTGLDLAQACRRHLPPRLNLALYLAAEAAIVACDLAEVIGTAVALKLLFGIPTALGAVLSALDAVLPLFLMNRGVRRLEAFVVSVSALIFVCFAIQIAAARPSVVAVLGGFLSPSVDILTNPEILFVAAGIVGATVMPHNLYLHSSLVRTRAYDRTEAGVRDAIKWATVDSTLALTLALFVNAAILVVSVVAFHETGRTDVADIEQAYELLSPLLGLGAASALFGVALLASGVNSTLTATLAGQVVMEGFIKMRLPPWGRRLLTRSLAILPAVIVTSVWGDGAAAKLLVLSQVVLSVQLPFAVIPLVLFVTDRAKMGPFVVSRSAAVVAWTVAGVLTLLNVKLLFDVAIGG